MVIITEGFILELMFVIMLHFVTSDSRELKPIVNFNHLPIVHLSILDHFFNQQALIFKLSTVTMPIVHQCSIAKL